MKRWTSVALSLSMVLTFSPGLIAKGGHGSAGNTGRGQGNGAVFAQNSNSNGKGTSDRDFGQDRAREVGNGKKKGLYKTHHSTGKHHSHEQNKSHKKDEPKKLDHDNRDKSRH